MSQSFRMEVSATVREGVPCIRYADDIVLLAKSECASERLLESSTKYCKCQYKIVGFLSYKNVGKPTRLYDILCNLIFLNHILHLIL